MRSLFLLLFALVALPTAAQTGTLTALVVADGEADVEGVRVDFYADGAAEPAVSGTADASGFVLVPDVPEGTYSPYVEPETGFYTQIAIQPAVVGGAGENGVVYVGEIDPAQGYVAGVIRDEGTGEPIADLLGVFIYEYADGSGGAAFSFFVTDGRGRYFAQAAPGTPVVGTFFAAVTFGEGEPEVGPVYYAPLDGFVLTIAAGETTARDLALESLPTGALAGTVTDAETGAPVPGAYVSASATGSAVGVGAEADADGRFELVVPEGEYLVAYDAEGYAQAYYDGASRAADATAVDVVAGATTGGVDAALSPAAGAPETVTFRGAVTDAATGALVPGATVEVFVPALDPDTPLYAAAAADGTYAVEVDGSLAVAFGVAVRASAEGYAPRFHVDAATLFEADVVAASPAEAEVVGIDVALRAGTGEPGGFAVRGTVTAEDTGAPLGGALVIAVPTDDDGEARVGVTAADGTYAVGGLGAGDHVVLFAADGYAPEYYNGQTDWTTADRLDVAGDLDGVDAAMGGLNRPVGARPAAKLPAVDGVEGWVRLDGGAPARAALVTVRDAAGGIVDFALTDGAGGFALDAFASDAASVQVSAVRYEVRERAYSALAGAPPSVIGFRLARAGAVAGEAAPTTAPPAVGIGVAPNPLRRAARVTVSLAEAAPVRVSVVDALGREVAVLADAPLGAGEHALALDAGGLAPGVYLVRVETTAGAAARPLTVVR